MKSRNKFKETWQKLSRFVRIQSPLQTVLLILTSLLVTIFIHAFVMQPYQVDGISMQPTLQDGEKLVVSKLGRSLASLLGTDFIPKRGEVIVFNTDKAGHRATKLIKRVIGLPGEDIAIRDGDIIIYNKGYPDGKQLDEQFSQDLLPPTSNLKRTAIGQRELFVIGDNRLSGASSDSRNTLGNIHVDNVVGVLEFRILPFDRFKFF